MKSAKGKKGNKKPVMQDSSDDEDFSSDEGDDWDEDISDDGEDVEFDSNDDLGSDGEDFVDSDEVQDIKPAKRKAKAAVATNPPPLKKVRTEAEKEQDNTPSACLYVGNLAPNTTEEMLSKTFPKANHCIVQKKKKSGRIRCGFVEFPSVAEAAKTKAKFQGHKIAGSAIKLGYYHVKRESMARPESKTLIVRNLQPVTDTETLEKKFELATDISVPTWRDSGNKRGFAILQFSTIEDAKLSREEMDKEKIDGKPVFVDFFTQSKPKGEGGQSKKKNSKPNPRKDKWNERWSKKQAAKKN